MIRHWRLIGILGLVALLSGCVTTGLSVRESAQANYSSYLYALYDEHFSGKEIQEAKGQPRQVRPLARLAVAQIGEVAPPHAMLEALARERELFADVQGIPAARDAAASGNASGETIRRQISQMRRFAADLGMDYLFLFGGTIDLGETATGATILDWTLVGAYVVPTHKVHAIGRASGALVDISTGQVMLVVTAEDELRTYETTVARNFGTSDHYLTQVRQQLIPKLTAALIERARQ